MAVTKPVWTPSSWRSKPTLHQPKWPSEERSEAARARPPVVPPLVFAGEARQLQAHRRGGRRARVPPRGRRVRRVVPRPLGRPHPREAEDHAADGGRPHLRRHAPGGEGGADRRTARKGADVRRPRRWAASRSPPSAATWCTTTRRRRGPPSRPGRMVQAYNHATATLNLVEAFTKGGFADLMRVHEWNQEFVASSPEAAATSGSPPRSSARSASWPRAASTCRPSRSCTRSTSGRATRASCSTTRRRSPGATRRPGDWYDCSAHVLWIGERTSPAGRSPRRVLLRRPQPARGEGGADGDARTRSSSSASTQPGRVLGRLTLIARMGAEEVFDLLPPDPAPCGTRASRSQWASDPMHANVFVTESGFKTRRFDAIMAEIEGFFAACRKERVWPGGVHLEFTGEDVTECLGGGEAVYRGAAERALHDALRPSPERPPVARPRPASGSPAPARPSGTLMALEKLAVVGTGLIGASVGLAASGRESPTSPDTTPTRSSWPRRPGGARSTSRSAASPAVGG